MTNDNADGSSDRDVEQLVGRLAGVGRAWARYGLMVGQTALETSAVTLRTTAEMLKEISERVARDREEAPVSGTSADKRAGKPNDAT